MAEALASVNRMAVLSTQLLKTIIEKVRENQTCRSSQHNTGVLETMHTVYSSYFPVYAGVLPPCCHDQIVNSDPKCCNMHAQDKTHVTERQYLN
jgi:hypothetical protein